MEKLKNNINNLEFELKNKDSNIKYLEALVKLGKSKNLFYRNFKNFHPYKLIITTKLQKTIFIIPQKILNF